MTQSPRIAIVPLGLSLGGFFVISYVLCVLFGLFISTQGMHQVLPMLLPGFTWISWPSFLLGLIWAFAIGWYITLVFCPLYNFFIGRIKAKN